MFYLKESLDAPTAESNGLVTKVVAGEFEKETVKRCEEIAEFSDQVSCHQCSRVSFLMHRDFNMRPL